jgi:hypothetical protein
MLIKSRELGLVRVQMTQEEIDLILEALHGLKNTKENALRVVNEALASNLQAPFPESDFGIPKISELISCLYEA